MHPPLSTLPEPIQIDGDAARDIGHTHGRHHGSDTLPALIPMACRRYCLGVMSIPYLTKTRLVPLRRLTPDECDLVEYQGPLMLARRERRFLFGPWRRDRDLLITRGAIEQQPEILMASPAETLRERGLRL